MDDFMVHLEIMDHLNAYGAYPVTFGEGMKYNLKVYEITSG